MTEPNKGVCDSNVKLYMDLAGKPGPAVAPHGQAMNIRTAITVEAVVHCETPRAEALQALVSKWSPLTSFDTFSAYDAAGTDGLDTRGFFGAVFDGRYVYFSPQRNGNQEDSTHGFVLRYDTQQPFKESGSWQAYDAGSTDDLETKGHYGAVFDGRFVYFVPRGKNYAYTEFQSRALRYDTEGDFKDRASWEAYDMGHDQTHQSACFDGKYIYFCPGYELNAEGKTVGCSNISRLDTGGGFKDPSSYASFDVSVVTELETGNYDGATFDGRYAYFVPLKSAVPLRYDTRGEFNDPGSWSAFDAKPLGMKMCVGAVFDGRFMYFVPYGQGMVVRFDVRGDFADRQAWSSFDAAGTDGLDTGGFDGGFFDGRYLYFAPFTRGVKPGEKKSIFHANCLRYDTSGTFDDPANWAAYDATTVDGLMTVGYNGGAFDGRYFYLAPWQRKGYGDEKVHAKILRYDTLGESGSFSLRYCDVGHNGGLCGAVPGPRFLVNTEKGPLSVAANAMPDPGRHYLVGVYDGRKIQLFMDGKLVNEQDGSGEIVTNQVDVTIGGLCDGLSLFDGRIEWIRISDCARTAEWIRKEHGRVSD